MRAAQYFQRFRIRQQLSAVLAAAVFTILLANLIVLFLTAQIVLKQSTQYADNTAEKFVKELEHTNEQALSLMNYLQYSDVIQDYFRREPYSNAFELYSGVERYLTGIRLIYPELDDIGLLCRYRNRSAVRDRDLEGILERHPDPVNLECDGILEQAGTVSTYKVLVYIRNYYGGELGTSYAHTVGQCLLVLRFRGETQAEGDTSFLVVDSSLHWLPLNCGEETAREIVSRIDPEELTRTIDNRQVFLRVHPVENSGLYVVSCTDKRLLLQDVYHVLLLNLLLCGAVAGILVLSILALNRSVVSPIFHLRRYMREITAGNYTQIKRKAEGRGNLEMVELAEDLNALIGELEDRTRRLFATTNRMYAMELEKRQAEVSFLRSQVNPHFLYNSLETIQGICMRGGLPEAARVAGGLGKIFRYSIKGEEIVPFREELEVVRAYVGIQSARFSQRLEVLYGISEETLDVPVIKMILQPVVENVFQHAVERSTERTTLYIASTLREDSLVITVQDDGQGIPPERLEQLRRTLEEAQGAHTDSIGLINVHLRIRLRYGPDYGLQVESQPGEGTKVALRLAVERDMALDEGTEDSSEAGFVD